MTETHTTQADKQIPLPALILGGAGLIPFLVPTLVALTPALESWRQIGVMFTLTYGAVILSFMAGIRWGTSMLVFQQDKMQLTKGLSLSVIPALLAYFLLIFPATIWAPLALALLHILQAASDIRASQKGELPAWYASLRFGLTFGASACLLAVAGVQLGLT